MNTNDTLVNSDIRKVDSHQHFWQLSNGYYHWLTPQLSDLYRDFLPHDLAPALKVGNVEQTILVQAADTEVETQFLLNIAKTTNFVAGVVGWVDMEDPCVLIQLKKLASNPYFKGIRPMLQDIDDVNWVLNEQFSPVFDFLAENKFTFDALIKEIHLPNILILAERHPALKIVINHCAKPNISQSPSDLWKQRLSRLSSCPNVFVKLSGLLTEAAEGQVKVESIQPYFDHIIRAFGTSRVMWGSDWPVLNFNDDYHTWASLTQSLLNNYSHQDKCKIWAENAQGFYNLSPYQLKK